MAKKTWVITDCEKQTHQSSVTFDADELGIGDSSVVVSTLQGGINNGVQTIEVNTPKCRFVVLPTRGMSLWKAWSAEMEYGWKSPVHGPVHPSFVPLMEPSGLGWLDGFDELLVRCGLESNGAPEHDEEGKLKYPLHGRIANKPARKVILEADSDSGEISVSGEVEECRFHFLKLRLTARTMIKAGSATIQIHDTIENVSAGEAECQMLYHVNFGQPLLDAGSQFVAPIKTVVPRNEHAAAGLVSWQSYPAPQAGYEEQVYFLHLLGDEKGKTQTLLKNAHGTSAVRMEFNLQQLPVYTVWKNPTALEDGYVTGLEPGTNLPNPRSYEGEQGRVVKIGGGKSHSLALSLTFLNDAAEIDKVEANIAKLQGATEPQVYDNPQPGWCADA